MLGAPVGVLVPFVASRPLELTYELEVVPEVHLYHDQIRYSADLSLEFEERLQEVAAVELSAFEFQLRLRLVLKVVLGLAQHLAAL